MRREAETRWGAPPEVEVDFAGRGDRQADGRWPVDWRIRNRGIDPMHIEGTWLPHGRFRCGRQQLPTPLVVSPGQSARLRLLVQCNEEPGTAVENAFVILRVEWQGVAWGIFVRMRVEIDDQRAPTTVTEVITAQPVGFAEQAPEPHPQ